MNLNRDNPDEPGSAFPPAMGAAKVEGDDEHEPENERLEQLPEHEDDGARGTAASVGAGVMQAGGTAVVTGSATEERPTDAGDDVPPLVPPGNMAHG